MARQGYVFSEQEVQRIVSLLNTDLTASQIAERMHCSRSTVISINRRFNVREYAGRRSTWSKGITEPERHDDCGQATCQGPQTEYSHALRDAARPS
jgi:hypothetical protein